MRLRVATFISRSRLAVVVLFFLPALMPPSVVAQSPEPSPITISVFGDVVMANGLTSGGKVAVLAIWSNEIARSSRNGGALSQTTDADSGGSASVTFPRQLPPRTMVVVIDVRSGRIEVLAEEPRFRRVELAARRLKRDSAGDVEAVLSPFDYAVTVLIRPAVGAWIHTGGDGGASDDDGRPNGGVRTRPAAMTALGDAPPAPPRITPRDVVFSVDPHSGVFSIEEVTP
jgi:hypothetical protein